MLSSNHMFTSFSHLPYSLLSCPSAHSAVHPPLSGWDFSRNCCTYALASPSPGIASMHWRRLAKDSCSWSSGHWLVPCVLLTMLSVQYATCSLVGGTYEGARRLHSPRHSCAVGRLQLHCLLPGVVLCFHHFVPLMATTPLSCHATICSLSRFSLTVCPVAVVALLSSQDWQRFVVKLSACFMRYGCSHRLYTRERMTSSLFPIQWACVTIHGCPRIRQALNPITLRSRTSLSKDL